MEGGNVLSEETTCSEVLNLSVDCNHPIPHSALPFKIETIAQCDSFSHKRKRLQCEFSRPPNNKRAVSQKTKGKIDQRLILSNREGEAKPVKSQRTSRGTQTYQDRVVILPLQVFTTILDKLTEILHFPETVGQPRAQTVLPSGNVNE